jgi:hypothetical protein
MKLRCPHCNGRRTRTVRIPDTHEPACAVWYAAQCPDCYCTGPSAPTAPQAREAWDGEEWRRCVARDNRVLVRWACVHCGHRHVWRWPRHDVAMGGPVTLGCERCGAETRLLMAADGRCNPAEANQK